MKKISGICAPLLGFCILAAPCGARAAQSAAGVNPAAVDPSRGVLSEDGKTLWFDALDIGLEGQGWARLKHPYDRFPAEAEGKVTDGAWQHSHHSAGLAVRFVTDSPSLSVRWSLRLESLAMNHMAATGVSGVDLYARAGDSWKWIATGRPEKVLGNEKLLADNAPQGLREYRMYLPLYNGIERLEIGILPGTTLAKAPPYPPDRALPMVFWGTSILQGGCASRPGMAYPAIIGRRMHRPSINLGFSGFGKMDPEVTALLAKLDASVFVIDCAPNMAPELITERAEPLVRALRAAHPATPIVLVENIVYQQAWYLPQSAKSYREKNDALRAACMRLMSAGVKNLHYIPGDHLLGEDAEATVDGTHPTDLGFLRMADAIEPVLRRIME